jgi:integrase
VRDTGNKPHRIIHFDTTLSDGRRLSEFPNLVETIKRIAFGIRHGPLLRVESGTVQAEKVLSLMTLTRWMATNRIFHFSELTSQDQWEYADLARGGVHEILNTEGTLLKHLEALANHAHFSPRDTPDLRRAKALHVLPIRWNGRQPILRREELMESAGLGGIPISKSLRQLLDDFELSCEIAPLAGVRGQAIMRVSKDDDDAQPVTTEQVRRLLMPFELLYEHRRYLDDTLRTRPFQGQALKEIARRFGSDIGRTATIPVAQAATVIERAIRWVVDYSPHILAAKEAIDTGKSPVLAPAGAVCSGPANPFPLRPRLRRERGTELRFEITASTTPGAGLTLYLALPLLAAACSIVIAAFSARRAAELVGLKNDCIVRDASGSPWLRSFIHKTMQSDGTVPVPEIVAAAVVVLEKLSANARECSKTDFLFQFNLPGRDYTAGIGSSGVSVFPLGKWVREFGYFADVPPLADGSRWTFRPHQFRRFFAVLYIWCYELADWGALSYHLRHFTQEHTRRYVTDTELGAILHQANKQRTAELLTSVALGNRHLSGPGGERLQHAVRRISNRLAQHLEVVPERKLNRRLTHFIERTGLDLRAFPWGYCASPLAEGVTAHCTSNTGPADLQKATVSICTNCPRYIREPLFRPYLSESLKRHQAIAANPNSDVRLKEASQLFIREVSDWLDSLDSASASRGTESET